VSAPTETISTPDIDASDEYELLAWWKNPITIGAMAIALLVLSAALGFVVGNNTALADPNDTDVGFLQDMRVHHEQAVQMGLIYLNTDGTDPALRTIAREIVVGQNIEIGRMIQLLRDFGKSEVNETDIAMTWMGEPIAVDRMPGLATDDDLIALSSAQGSEADAMFVKLMSAHHEGGIHMADMAASMAGTDEVKLMAKQIAGSQREEIVEMAQLAAA
jgi:uncharacterized protein (DUF305 family)